VEPPDGLFPVRCSRLFRAISTRLDNVPNLVHVIYHVFSFEWQARAIATQKTNGWLWSNQCNNSARNFTSVEITEQRI
jgi:hypothetical protein